MLKKELIVTTIERGIGFLAKQQRINGNFISLSFSSLSTFTSAIQYETTFMTSLILDCLNSVQETSELKKVKKAAASFLMTQKNEDWSFNYWVRHSKEAKEMPYPDDLDDTFCALASLFRYEPDVITGGPLARIVQLLTNTEVQEGGPYKTWLVGRGSEAKWKDVDIAVNSNIAYFLSLNDISLPKLHTFIERRIEEDKLESVYYPSFYPIIYFISRFYRGKYVDHLQKLLLSQRDKEFTWGNPLHTALAVSALLNLGSNPNELGKSIGYLVQEQKENCWPPYAFCLDPMRDGKMFYAGSSALTTAFCLEVLSKYLKAQERVSRKKNEQAEADVLFYAITQKVEQVFAKFDRDFKTNAFGLLSKLVINDKSKQITLLPYFFTLTLGEKRKIIPQDLLLKLGAANVLGWIAYTIYDDFLDEEGDPVMLSIANVALRELTSIFESILPENIEFKAFFHTIMDRLDEANAWEVSHCRIKAVDGKVDVHAMKIPQYGEYEKLAYKSLGHVLGPLAILFFLGYKWNSPEIKNMLSFFEYYLIVKQLNDDAHDWEKDLKVGQVNPAIALLFKKVYRTHIRGKGKISFTELLPDLQKLFWYEVIDDICRIIFRKVGKAKIILKQCVFIQNPAILEQLIVHYEQTARTVLQEKKQAVEFLKVYQEKK